MADNPYSQPTLTGYNTNPPGDDGSTTATNALTWAKHKDKLGDPLKSFATDMDANILSAFAKTINIGDAQANPVSGSISFVSDTLTLVSGSVTPDRSHHLIDTESAGATDELDTITTGSVGDETILYLNSVNASRVVSVRDGVGNIHLARTESSTELDLDVNRPLVLIRNGTDWYQVEAIADKIESRNTGATGAPDFILYRNSASPAASDVLGRVRFTGEDSAGNEDAYAQIQAEIDDPASGSEDGTLAFHTVVAGTLAARMSLVGSNFGIGELSPDDLLHITGGAFRIESAAPRMGWKETDSNADENWQVQVEGGNWLLRTQNDAFTSANTKMVVRQDGNVGIGTVVPDYRFHIIATATDVALFESSAATANIWLQDSGTTDNKSVGIGSSGDDMVLNAGGTNVLTLASGGVVSGTVMASPAETEAGTATNLFVTPEGVEESRKRLRGQTTSTATAISMTATMAGELIRTTNAGPITFTVPQDTMTANDVVHIYQEAAGQVTMAAGGTVVLNNANGLKTSAVNSVLSLFFLTSNLAVVTGDSAA